jgi:hypothetical protein
MGRQADEEIPEVRAKKTEAKEKGPPRPRPQDLGQGGATGARPSQLLTTSLAGQLERYELSCVRDPTVGG